MKISIVTATYNRAKNLENLYRSILKQNSKNMEWIIIDDGSTDETNKIVEKFIQEKKIDIKYFYQENSGKMQAINNVIKHITGEFFLECDSDDYLTDNAIKNITEAIKENKKQNVYAYVFLKLDQNLNIIGTKIKNEKRESTMFDLYFKDNTEGDKALVFNSNIRKQYLHRLEKNEKFITEARLYNEMDKKHKIIGINEEVMICEYKSDGYSRNIRKIYKENPKGFFEYFKQLINFEKKGISFSKKLYIVKHYILFATLAKEKNIIKKISNIGDKIITAILIIPGKFIIKNKFKENKKILISAYSLEIGGIESALINLINRLSREFEITLVLENKKGLLLNCIDKNIQIIEYCPSKNKNFILRKVQNFFNRVKFLIRNKNKYKFSLAFTTYSIPGAFCARNASKNNAFWIHSDYTKIYDGDKIKIEKFFKKQKVEKFKHVVCVSNAVTKSAKEIFKKIENRIITINNFIDEQYIINQSKKAIPEKKQKEYTFLNVSRHDEHAKKISRIIDAAKILDESGYNFKIFLIGKGVDTEKYLEQIKKMNLQEKVLYLGEKENPYPYFNICDSIIMTSDYEGYPVVYLESIILKRPIITTNVSDAELVIDKKFGIVTDEFTPENIAKYMASFIKSGFEIKGKFDVKEYNNKIELELKKII